MPPEFIIGALVYSKDTGILCVVHSRCGPRIPESFWCKPINIKGDHWQILTPNNQEFWDVID